MPENISRGKYYLFFLYTKVDVPGRMESCHSLSLYSQYGEVALIFLLSIPEHPVRMSAKICPFPFFSFFSHYSEIDAETF